MSAEFASSKNSQSFHRDGIEGRVLFFKKLFGSRSTVCELTLRKPQIHNIFNTFLYIWQQQNLQWMVSLMFSDLQANYSDN